MDKIELPERLSVLHPCFLIHAPKTVRSVMKLHTRRPTLIFAYLLLVGCSGCISSASADDWPQWLGPMRDGVWREDNIIEEFPSGGPEMRWEVALGGGYSGPAVANGKVIVMDRIASGSLEESPDLHDGNPPRNRNFLRRKITGRERVVCFREEDGKQLWAHEYDCPYSTVALYAIGPRVTPTVDGDRVYTLGAEGDLFCLDVETGRPLWSKNFVEDFGWQVTEWGASAHPLVDGDQLICVVGGEGSTVVAFDKYSGEEIWRNLDARQSGYCPPVIYEIHGQRHLVIWHSDALVGLNPATGEIRWQVPIQATFAMTIGMPRIMDNRLFVMSFNRQSHLVEITKDHHAEVIWSGAAKSGVGGVMNAPWLTSNHIYGCGPDGRYTCASLLDGEHLWETYQPTTGKRPASWGTAFTIPQGDRFFIANDLGDLIIAKLSPTGYQEISRAHLIDPTHNIGGRDVVWSHPAFANRSVYLRNDKHLRCFSLEK